MAHPLGGYRQRRTLAARHYTFTLWAPFERRESEQYRREYVKNRIYLVFQQFTFWVPFERHESEQNGREDVRSRSYRFPAAQSSAYCFLFCFSCINQCMWGGGGGGGGGGN